MTEPEERCECCDLPVYSCGRSAEAQQRREDEVADSWGVEGW